MDLSGAYVIDIESSGLLEDMVDHREFPYRLKPDSKLWCVVIRNVKTGEAVSATGDDITKEWLSKALENCNILIAHHGVKFDFPALRLFGVFDYKVAYPEEKYSKVFDKDVLLVDTHVWSRLFNPDRLGGHSLEAWGERLGYPKIDWRGEAVKLGLIQHNSPQGAEFKQYHPNMLTYCEQDTTVNMHVFLDLIKELDYKGWSQAIRVETKLADLAVNRETLGFYFDTEAANNCLEDLTQKLEDLHNKVTPLLPPRPMNSGERKTHTPPKRQLTAKGEPTSYLRRFAETMDVVLWEDEGQWYFGGYELPMPEEPIRTTLPATIDDGDWVKMFLISLGWVPTEWKERDLTKNSKKQNLPYQKRVEALGRWFKETTEGKYKEQRLAILGLAEEEVLPKLMKRLKDDRPVRVPTSPCVRVGVEKDLCPNLVELGDKVAFAKDFALYLTYKHRRTSISGGEMDEDGEPTKGFLSQVRTEDNRIPTPAIEIGASTNRYRHVGVANIPRASSIYGKEMRSLFGCGTGFLQLGYDFSSLEGRIEGQYCYVYPEGPEYAETLIAEKPNDIHCFSEDTEILTTDGWQTFSSITKETKVAQFSPKEKRLSWVTPTEVIWEKYRGEMVHISNPNTDQLVTPNHRVLITSCRGRLKTIMADTIFNETSSDSRFLNGGILTDGFSLDQNLIKLIVATQADGCLAKDCSAITFSFTKQRKIERLKQILETLNCAFSESKLFRKGRLETTIRVKSSETTVEVRKWLQDNKTLSTKLIGLDLVGKKELLCELGYWDGTVTESGVVLDITDEGTIDVLQAICATSNLKSTVTKFMKKTSYGVCPIVRLFISTKVPCWSGVKATRKEIVSYDGMVGCVTVESGYVLVRRNGKVFISGNSVNARKLGIPRDAAKSIKYGITYGAQPPKIAKMLNKEIAEGEVLFNGFWDAAPALKELKTDVERGWVQTGKTYIIGVDGRKIRTRSQHSLLNALFQSAGVIAAKYTTVYSFQMLEEQGYCISPFDGKPDVCSMIEYHDEAQLVVKSGLIKFQTFDSKEEVEAFVENYKGGQLSSISQGKRWFVALPNDISVAIDKAIKKTCESLKLNVPLGFEWTVGKNWYDCH